VIPAVDVTCSANVRLMRDRARGVVLAVGWR
jgi:hypothetical protein